MGLGLPTLIFDLGIPSNADTASHSASVGSVSGVEGAAATRPVGLISELPLPPKMEPADATWTVGLLSHLLETPPMDSSSGLSHDTGMLTRCPSSSRTGKPLRT